MASKGNLSLELPPDLAPGSAQYGPTLNERMRRIALEIEKLQGARGPVTLLDALGLGGNRITDLGDPQSGSDALSRSAGDKRYLIAGSTAAIAPKPAASPPAKVTPPPVPPGTSTGAGIKVIDRTLSANAVALPTPGVAPGDLVLVVIREDGAGGWKQTWPVTFIGMAGFLQTTTAQTYTAALFYTADGTSFQLIAAPITGAQ